MEIQRCHASSISFSVFFPDDFLSTCDQKQDIFINIPSISIITTIQECRRKNKVNMYDQMLPRIILATTTLMRIQGDVMIYDGKHPFHTKEAQ